ncbi:hypothetical protein PTKIN_Ptkin18bG0069200 [Pterospermum kingtungense]
MLPLPAMADDEPTKETNMTVYFHDYSSPYDPNATNLSVVGFPGKVWSVLDFKTLVVDDLLTEGPELTSPTVGRGQGIFTSVSLDGTALMVPSHLCSLARPTTGAPLRYLVIATNSRPSDSGGRRILSLGGRVCRSR